MHANTKRLRRGAGMGLVAVLAALAGCAPMDDSGLADGAMAPSVREDRVEYAAPPGMVDSSTVDEVIVSGSRVDGKASGETTPSPRPVPGRRPPPPQSGLLTAGDYDDLLNPRAYARYVESKIQNGEALPFVDTRAAITIAVTDSRGAPISFADVSVSRPNGGPLTLTTVSDGTVVLFPALDRLGRTAEVSIRAPGGGATRRTLAVGTDRRLELNLPGRAAPVGAMDLLLVIDATGSMSDEMNYLKTEIEAIMASLAERHPGLDARIGLIVYRDTGDEYVVRQYPFTANVGALQTQLSKQSANGGGDYPEAMDEAMAAAVAYPWRAEAAKALVLVADAPPHDDRIQATWATTLQARDKRIQIIPVAASGVADKAEFVMRSMAAVTQSRYLFLTDDSGVGNPHAAPEVKCYVVTRLDALLRRVLDGIISGRRIEPSQQEIIRRVGDYDDGVCEPRS